ncbi:hypothetical protein Golob_005355, partial [Gossypium lobatum]|nr:hypothetical protein [Gossypium lobatum]
MSRDDISLLEEELIHLTVKSSLVVPNGKSTLLRMIKIADQNFFKIEFEDEGDLELIMGGRPWFFRRNLVLVHLNVTKKTLYMQLDPLFEESFSSELMEEFCRIKVELDVQKPLRRGIFILVGTR